MEWKWAVEEGDEGSMDGSGVEFLGAFRLRTLPAEDMLPHTEK